MHSTQSILYLAPRPVPTPDRCVLVSAKPIQTIDGSEPPGRVLVSTGNPARGQVEQARIHAPARMVEAVEAAILPNTEAVWIAHREQLHRWCGDSLTRIETTLLELTRDNDLYLRAFSNRDTASPPGCHVYGEVREDVSLSTHRPNTHA